MSTIRDLQVPLYRYIVLRRTSLNAKITRAVFGDEASPMAIFKNSTLFRTGVILYLICLHVHILQYNIYIKGGYSSTLMIFIT